jgi:hypothetical protein
MDLASKNPTGGQNCDARHDATDILTDTSPVFRHSSNSRTRTKPASEVTRDP